MACVTKVYQVELCNPNHAHSCGLLAVEIKAGTQKGPARKK